MYLLLIFILLALNGLFVMAEMALVSSRKGRLQAKAEHGDRGSRTALELIEQPTRYLSTIQIVITLSGIGLGMFGEASIVDDIEHLFTGYPRIAAYAHAISVALTMLLLTVGTLVFAELVPKRLGQMFPEGLARLLSRPMDMVGRITSPLVSLLTWATDLILSLVPLRPARDDDAAEEEVKAIIASGTESGVFHQTEQDMVERVFRLSDQKVTSIMVPRTDIDFLQVGDSIQRVRVAIATSAHSHFPVCAGSLDELIGVVHVKDLVKHGLVSDTINLRDLARPPMFVPESTICIRLLDQFKKTHNHIAFVVDEYGSLIGLVTLNDLIDALVGEMSSGGPHDPSIVRRPDGSYLMDGHVPVTELKELLDLKSLPGEDTTGYQTLGGFVMAHLGRIPATGDRFEFDRFHFEVVDMDRTRVDKVLVTITEPPTSDQAAAI